MGHMIISREFLINVIRDYTRSSSSFPRLPLVWASSVAKGGSS